MPLCWSSPPSSTGTFWYHSHHSTQYCDGLRGPIVVYDPNDPQRHLYDVDNGEHLSIGILILYLIHPLRVHGDHSFGLVPCRSQAWPALSVRPGLAFVLPSCVTGDPSRLGSDSTLINGLGRSASTNTAELAVIKVTHGKR